MLTVLFATHNTETCLCMNATMCVCVFDVRFLCSSSCPNRCSVLVLVCCVCQGICQLFGCYEQSAQNYDRKKNENRSKKESERYFAVDSTMKIIVKLSQANMSFAGCPFKLSNFKHHVNHGNPSRSAPLKWCTFRLALKNISSRRATFFLNGCLKVLVCHEFVWNWFVEFAAIYLLNVERIQIEIQSRIFVHKTIYTIQKERHVLFTIQFQSKRKPEYLHFEIS